MKIWKAIETAPEAAATISWRRWLDPMFDQVNQAWLRDTQCRVEGVPCTNDCGCNHRVQQQGNGFVGICDCGKSCSDILLSAEDVKELKLSLDSLGFELARALGCTSDKAELGLHRTKQVASFGDQCVPIILTIQQDQERFHKIVRQLVEQLKGRFILLAPTNRFAGENSLGLLKQARAHFFSLGPNVRLWPSGKFQATKRGEEWFSPYLREDSNRGHDSSRRDERERSVERFIFRRAGSVYEVVFDGSPSFHIDNTLGASCLDYLLHHPNIAIKAFDLEVAVHPEKAGIRVSNSIQTTGDTQARSELTEELSELEEEREEAEARESHDQVKRLEEEIAITKTIAGNTGLLDGDTGERARDNIRKAIGKVVNNMKKGDKLHQSFGRYLQHNISLGYEVMYTQPEGRIWA